MTEHGGQHTESNEVEKGPIKISKTLNSEYMRNRKMIESTEKNVKYVKKYVLYKRKICSLICRI